MTFLQHPYHAKQRNPNDSNDDKEIFPEHKKTTEAGRAESSLSLNPIFIL